MLDPLFERGPYYQSSIERWNDVSEAYGRMTWAKGLLNLVHNVAPLSKEPRETFRRIVGEIRSVRGELDAANDRHIGLLFEVSASMLLLWVSIGREVRRLFDPSMSKSQFESVLRYYIWGGREAYEIRRQLKEVREGDASESGPFNFPGWEHLVAFAGLAVSAPQEAFEGAKMCREMAFRAICGVDSDLDKNLKECVLLNKRVRQFSISMVEYLSISGGLPKPLYKEMERRVLGLQNISVLRETVRCDLLIRSR
jgi:hypothetical protein